MGSDNESSHCGRDVANHTPPVASTVLHHDIAGRQHQLRAIVKLYYYVTGEKDPEIRPGLSPFSTCIPGVASGATTSNSGEYVAMTNRMPPTGGNIPGAAGLFPAFG